MHAQFYLLDEHVEHFRVYLWVAFDLISLQGLFAVLLEGVSALFALFAVSRFGVAVAHHPQQPHLVQADQLLA